jgi:ABC-2 type transport system ATP-binding protein
MIVQARGVEKAFGRHQVLEGIDLEVGRGSVHALLGPNGAGKTTIVRILSTLSRPDAGEVRVDGFDVVRQPGQVRRVIGLTGQYAAVDEPLSGRENLLMMARLCRLSPRQARERVLDLLTRFDLLDAARRPVAAYSGGMRRRLDLAASLVGRPRLIILDEPTTGLDPASRQTMWQAVRGLVSDGATVLLTTQYLEEADQLADRITLIDAGRVVAEGTADELKRDVGDERAVLGFVDTAGYDAARGVLGELVLDVDATRLSVEVPTDGSAAAVRDLLDHLHRSDVEVSTIALHRPTLDDVFLTMTGRTPVTEDNDDSDDNAVQVLEEAR